MVGGGVKAGGEALAVSGGAGWMVKFQGTVQLSVNLSCESVLPDEQHQPNLELVRNVESKPPPPELQTPSNSKVRQAVRVSEALGRF